MPSWSLLVAILLVLAVHGRTTPLDICLRSVVSTVIDGCQAISLSNNYSVFNFGYQTNGFFSQVSRCFTDTVKDISLLAPDMAFTAFVKSMNDTAYLLMESDTSSGYDEEQHSLNISTTNISFWGRTLAEIGGVPPFYLGLNLSTNFPEYDGWMVDPIALADLYDSQKTMDLSAVIQETPYRQRLEWFGIHQLFRGSVVVDKGSVASIPLGGLVYQMYYRQDVLERHQLRVPITWDDFLDVAAAVNGTDMNGDGEPDYGVCLQRPRYCFNGFSLAAIWSSFIQSGGTKQGAFFEPVTLQPLVNNSAMARAMEIFLRLRAFGPPEENRTTCRTYNQDFVNGKCAMTLSWGYQLKANLFRRESRVQNTTRVALLPGSTQVLDRTTGQLVECTSRTVCPFAEEMPVGRNGTRKLVNRAPYLALSTASGGISAQANAWHQTKLLDLFSHLASPNMSWKLVTDHYTELGPYRFEHFDPMYTDEWVRNGYPKEIITEFLDVMKQQLDSGNVMMEVRTVQAYAYRRLLDVYASGVSNGEMSVQAAIEKLAIELQNVYGAHNPRFETIRRLYRYSIGLGDINPQSVNATSERSSSAVLHYAVSVPLIVAALLVAAVAAYAARKQRRVKLTDRGPKAHPGLGDNTTLVVSDVEGSTVLWEAIEPGVMDVVFNLHHDCMRRTAVQFDGYESQTEGDSFIIAFHSANEAVRFALAVQQSLLEEPWPKELLAHEKCRPVWLTRSGIEVPLDIPLEPAVPHRASVPYANEGSRHGTAQGGTSGSFVVSNGPLTSPGRTPSGGTLACGAGGFASDQTGSPAKQTVARSNFRQMMAARRDSTRRRVHSMDGGNIQTAGGGLPTGGGEATDGVATSNSGVCADAIPIAAAAAQLLPSPACSVISTAVAPSQPPLPLTIQNVGEALRALWREVPAHIADHTLSGAYCTARWQGVKAVFRPSMSCRPSPFPVAQMPLSTLVASTAANAVSVDPAQARLGSAVSLTPFIRSRSLPVRPVGTLASKPDDTVSTPVTTIGNAIADCGGGDTDGLGDAILSSAGGARASRVSLDDNDAHRSLSDGGRLPLPTLRHSTASSGLPARYSSGAVMPAPATFAGFATAGSVSMGRRIASAAAAAAAVGLGLARSASAGTGRHSVGGLDLAAVAPAPTLVLSANGAAPASSSFFQQPISRWGIAQRMLRLQSHTHPYLRGSVQTSTGPSARDDSINHTATVAAAPPPTPIAAPPPPCTLVKRGLSVRIGMHTGVRHLSDLVYSDVAKRWKYSGEVLAAAKAVSDAANGGDVLISTATLERLDPELLAKRCRLLYLGRHLLRGGDVATATVTTTSTQPPPPPPGPGVMVDLYAVYSPRLLPRVGLYRPPRTELPLGLSVMDAPLGQVTYGLLVCHGLSNIAAAGHDSAVVSEAQSVLKAISEDQLLACHGVPAVSPQAGNLHSGTVVGAFRNPYHAILWALQAQEDLLRFPWSSELLSHEQFEAIVVPASAADALIGGGPSQAEPLSAHFTPVATPTYASTTTASQRHGVVQGVDIPPGETQVGFTVSGPGMAVHSGRVLSGISDNSAEACGPSSLGGCIGGAGGTAIDVTESAAPSAAATYSPQSTAWVARTSNKCSNRSLNSFDGTIAVGTTFHGGRSASWKGGSVSMRVRQSAPGQTMPLQRQVTTAAAAAAVASFASASLGVLSCGAIPSAAPYDSACEVSTTDGERDSATVTSVSGCLSQPMQTPPMPAPGAGTNVASLSVPFSGLSIRPSGPEPCAISEEVDAPQAHPPTSLPITCCVPAAVSTSAAALAAVESGGDMVLYRGPRIKGAISYGPLKASLDPLTGRIRYDGKAASYAAKMASYASIGMVVASVEAVEAGHAEDSDGNGFARADKRGTGCEVGTMSRGSPPVGDGGVGVATSDIARRSLSGRPPLSRVGSFREDHEGPSAAIAAAAAAAAAALLNISPGGGGILHRSGRISLDTIGDPFAQLATALVPGAHAGNQRGDSQLTRAVRAGRVQQSHRAEDTDVDGRSSNSGPLLCGGGGGGAAGSAGGSRFPSGYSTPFSGASYTYSQNPLFSAALKPESRAASRTTRTKSNLNPDSRQASRTAMQQPCTSATGAVPLTCPPEAIVRRLSRTQPQVHGEFGPGGTAHSMEEVSAGGNGAVPGVLAPSPAVLNSRTGVARFSPTQTTVMWRTSGPGTAALAIPLGYGGWGEGGHASSDGRPFSGSYWLDTAQQSCSCGDVPVAVAASGLRDSDTVAVAEDPDDAPDEVPEQFRAQAWHGSSAVELGNSTSPPPPEMRPTLQNMARGLLTPSSPRAAAVEIPAQLTQTTSVQGHLETQESEEEEEEGVMNGEAEEKAPIQLPLPAIPIPFTFGPGAPPLSPPTDKCIRVGQSSVLSAVVPSAPHDDKMLVSGPSESTGGVLSLMGRQAESRRRNMYVSGRGFGVGAILLQQQASATGESKRDAAVHGVSAQLRNPVPDSAQVVDRQHISISLPTVCSVTAGVPGLASNVAAGGNGVALAVSAPVTNPPNKPSPLRRSHGSIAVGKVPLAAAFGAVRSSSLRHGDSHTAATAAAAAFAAGRSSSLRHGVCDGLLPALPPADILRQRQHLMLLQQQRDSRRVFLGSGHSNPSLGGILRSSAQLPSVQVLSHSPGSGGGGGSGAVHHSQTQNLQPHASVQHFHPQLPQPIRTAPEAALGVISGFEHEPSLAGGSGGITGTISGTSPPRVVGTHLGQSTIISAAPVQASQLTHISSWRSSTSSSFVSAARAGTATTGGGPMLGTSSHRVAQSQIGQQGRPSGGGTFLPQPQAPRRWEATVGSGGHSIGFAGTSGPVPSSIGGHPMQLQSGSGANRGLCATGYGGGAPGASEPQPMVSQGLAAVGFDEVSMMPVALKKRGHSQPLVVYMCRFASSARTFEMQQRLVKMGHGNPTAAAAAVAAAAAAAAAAPAPEIPGGSYTDLATTGGLTSPLETGGGSEASLAQLAVQDTAATGSGTGHGAVGASRVGGSVGGGGGGGLLSERLDKKLNAVIGIFAISRLGNGPGLAAGSPSALQPQQQHASFVSAVGARRSSMTGLYPVHSATPLELSRRSVGTAFQGDVTLAVNMQQAATTFPDRGRFETAHDRTVSCAGVVPSSSTIRGGVNIRSSISGVGSGGGGFMRRFRRTSLDVVPQKRRTERTSALHVTAGMLSSYSIGRPMGEVRTMSVKRVQRGTTSGPLITLSPAGGVPPVAVASATLPTIHAHKVFSATSTSGIGMGGGGGGNVGVGLVGAVPYDVTAHGLCGATQQQQQQNRCVHGATGPLFLVSAAGASGSVVQRSILRSTANAGVVATAGAHPAPTAAGIGSAISTGGSPDESPRGSIAVASAGDAVTGGGQCSTAGGPCASASLSSQPLFILGYGGNGGAVGCDCVVGSSWDYGGRPVGLVSRAPALMTPTEEGTEMEVDEEDEV